jgi:type IV pilus assembly protein PilY1
MVVLMAVKTVVNWKSIMKNLNYIKLNYISTLFALPLVGLSPVCAWSQVVVSDTLTGPTSTYPWKVLGDACLTAATAPAADGSSLGACRTVGVTQVGGVNGTLPDPVGKGALRLTNGGNDLNRTGAVLSTIPFPTNLGLQVTFTTATYGGNGYGNLNNVASGADGLAFFLIDASKTPLIGSFGGSLGYSCSNRNGEGFGANGGYVAVGIDELGNFSNKVDSTSDGDANGANAIVLRGAGSINYAALNQAYPRYYPSGLGDKAGAVKSTCRAGMLQNWSGGTLVDANNNSIADRASTTEPVHDYNLLRAPSVIAGPIFNQQNVALPLRTNANLITYDLSITQDNLLSLSYSYNGGATIPVLTRQSITANNGPLPANFLFGFTSGTGGGTNVHEITCFKAGPINVAGNSAGANVQQSAPLQVGSQVYFSFYHPLNAWGQLTASNLYADANGRVTIASLANWDASCKLTGGVCPATGGTDAAAAAQGAADRTVVTWNGTTGVPFRYGSLATAETTALGGAAGAPGRIAYLRGDRANELTPTGTGLFRRRDGLLGDIINSSPTWVGAPALQYSNAGDDQLSKTAVAEFGTAYADFVTSNRTRTNVVYTGANDGMLHGFRAGAFDAAGAFSTAVTPNDGRELLAYVPKAVADSIHTATTTLDFSSPQYAHNAYVDATPGTGDLYYKGAWHTWLVGGLGAGGNPGGAINNATSTALGALFALVITNPDGFSEASASSFVVKEWSSANLVCVNNSTCRSSLGSTYGTPIIRRMHDGNWAVIFGNGRNSATGTAGIFIMSVNQATGATTFRFLDTRVKSTSDKNGIDYVASADLDEDRVIDYLYAGDKRGNIWRFNVTSSDPSAWAKEAAPLFTTPSGQPISTRIAVSSVLPRFGPARVVLGFGTGRRTPQTLTSAAAYASGAQSLYGIWDWQMTAWNAFGSTQYAALTGANSFTDADLQTQTITNMAGGSGSISGYRTVTQKQICWKDSGVCAASNTQYGWKLALPTATEQIVYNPTLAYGALIVNTTIPAVSGALSCVTQPATGYTMAISMATGGAPAKSLFKTAASDAGIPANDKIAGLGMSGTGTPSIIATSPGKATLLQQTTSGNGVSPPVDVPPNTTGKRITWKKLR